MLHSYACDLYTYGSPRVGNLALVKYVTNQVGAEYRATHFDDPVPRLPPILFGYFHTSPEYWLAAGPATNTDYTIDEIKTCTGYANIGCNAGTFGLDGDAHLRKYTLRKHDCLESPRCDPGRGYIASYSTETY